MQRLIAIELWLLGARTLNRWIMLLLFGAMLIAVATGTAHVRAQTAEIDRATAEAAHAAVQTRAAAQAIGLGRVRPEQYRDPTDPYGYLFYFARLQMARPLAPLAVIATGDSDLRPVLLKIIPGQAQAEGAGVIANPRLARIGSFDLAFVLVYLVPLALIACFGATISSERESGALPLILSQGLTPQRLAVAKFAATASVAISSVVAMMLLALWMAGVAMPAQSGALLVISAALALYVLFWIGLIALCAALCATAIASLTRLTIAWTVLLFILPLALGWYARATSVAQAPIVAIDAGRTAAALFDSHPARATRAWLSNRMPNADGALADRPDMQRLALDAVVVEAQRDARDAIMHRKNWMRGNAPFLQVLSPSLTFDKLLLAQAGNAPENFERFIARADAFSVAVGKRFEPTILRSAISKQIAPSTSVRHYERWAMPSERVVDALPRFWNSLFILASWAAISLAVATRVWASTMAQKNIFGH